MAKRQKETEPEAVPKSLWVRFNQQPGMPAGPHNFGPFATRLKPRLKISLTPGEWKEVNGEWATGLKESALSHMVDISPTKPD